MNTVRVLVALDVPAEQATDIGDLVASVNARLADEAGYLDSGEPVIPLGVHVTYVRDDTDLTTIVNGLAGVYEVGVEQAL